MEICDKSRFESAVLLFLLCGVVSATATAENLTDSTAAPTVIESKATSAREPTNREITAVAHAIYQKTKAEFDFPSGADEYSCIVQVMLGDNGELESVRVVKSSNNAPYDEAALQAVRKASPFGLPADPERKSKFRKFNIQFAQDRN